MKHPDFEYGVSQVANPESFFSFIKHWGTRKGTYLKPIKKALETIKAGEKRTLKLSQEELKTSEKEREAGFEEEGTVGKLIPD